MMRQKRDVNKGPKRVRRLLAVTMALGLVLTACGDGDDDPDEPENGDAAEDPADDDTPDDADDDGDDDADDGGDDGEPEDDGEETTLSLAHSYGEGHAHHRCGAVGLAEAVDAADIGLTIEIFPNSQLGGDADRFTSVASGDIDIDLQGASAIAASYEPAGITDAAYVFDDADHVFEWLDTDDFVQLQEEALDATGVHLLDAWWFGQRHFTANEPIRTPEDFEGLRMRFPDTPRYLANAEALGAEAVAVAFEEVYLSLQQGVIDGQENPIPTIDDMNFVEVQDYVSLTGHQAGFQFVIFSDETWQQLSGEQQEALLDAIREVRAEDRQCIEDDEQALLDEWEESGALEIIDDVDRDAFITRAEEYHSENLDGRELEIYESIRALR